MSWAEAEAEAAPTRAEYAERARPWQRRICVSFLVPAGAGAGAPAASGAATWKAREEKENMRWKEKVCKA